MLRLKMRNALQVLFAGLILILLAYLGSMGALTQYQELNKPLLALSGEQFGLIWAVLYLLILLATILVEWQSISGVYKKDALGTFWFQLILNAFWPYWFFVFRFRGIAFAWALLLLYFAWSTQRKYLNLSKVAGMLILPYSLFLIYATYLNLFMWMLN